MNFIEAMLTGKWAGLNRKRLASWLIGFIIVGACVYAGASAPSDRTGREYAEIMLLTSHREFDMRLGMQSLRRLSLKNQGMTDLLAEITWTACAGERIVMYPDALSWAIKLIGETKNRRYAEVINYCAGKVTAPGPVKYLGSTKSALSEGTPSDPYVGGTVDLQGVRNETYRNRKANPPKDVLQRRFAELGAGQSIDEVYSALGAPDQIFGVSVPRGRAGFLFVRVKLSSDQIEFYYLETGTARFGYDETSRRWLLADATSSNPARLWVAPLGRFGTELDLAEYGDVQDLRILHKKLTDEVRSVNPELLDRIVDRIYFSQMETDGPLVVALSHFCTLVGSSATAKYKPVLAKIAETAEHRTLRKYAGRAAQALPQADGAIYMPKGVSDLNTPPPRKKEGKTHPPIYILY